MAEVGSKALDAQPSEAQAASNIDVETIMRMIPHRYPMLLVDRIRTLEPYKGAVGLKNVTINEPFFMGHFPQKPIMPGVLIVEALAQTAAVLVVHTLNLIDKGSLVYFMTIDNTRFRKPVLPGDCVELHVDVQKYRGPVWKFSGLAKVDGVICAQSDFSAMIVDSNENG